MTTIGVIGGRELEHLLSDMEERRRLQEVGTVFV